MKKRLKQLEIRRLRGKLRGLFCQLSTISIFLTSVTVRYCQPREDGSSVTGAPPQLHQGPPAGSVGLRLGGTATTGPTPACPARPSSGGHSLSLFIFQLQLDIFRCVKRRSYLSLKCEKGLKCPINLDTRRTCMACRWTACIAAGMNRPTNQVFVVTT